MRQAVEEAKQTHAEVADRLQAEVRAAVAAREKAEAALKSRLAASEEAELELKVIPHLCTF